jgi:RNA polymerase sigma-70 factor, ECF subfamily
LDRFLAGVEQRAYRMARFATGHGEEALDLVQDAMMILVKRYAERPEAEWPALFHRILQNRIRDWYRRRRTRAALFDWWADVMADDRLPEDVAVEPAAGPFMQLANEQLLEQLEVALQALTLRQQQAFLLRVWEGMDVRQTAAAMDISEGSVKTHYSRAVHRLRQSLGDFRHAGA